MSLLRLANPNHWRGLLRHGDTGPDVAAWQIVLLENGHDLTDFVGEFQDTTHNATMSWQHDRKLDPDGIVGPMTKRALMDPPYNIQPALPTFPDEIKTVRARHWSKHLPPRTEVRWIVIHCMEAPESSTRAEVCASNFAKGDRRASCHYCVDVDSIVQCVDEHHIAWHCPGANRRGIGIEHAGYARQSRDQWLDSYGQKMLSLSAELCAQICKRWNIPAVAVDVEGLRGKEWGITTHAAVSHAFKKSKHWDPGPHFPLDWYVDAVQVALDKLG